MSERDIVAVARETGARCPKQVYAHLGCAPRCGSCLDFAADMLGQREAEALPGPAGALVYAPAEPS